jgi:hypothetical protein
VVRQAPVQSEDLQIDGRASHVEAGEAERVAAEAHLTLRSRVPAEAAVPDVDGFGKWLMTLMACEDSGWLRAPTWPVTVLAMVRRRRSVWMSESVPSGKGWF